MHLLALLPSRSAVLCRSEPQWPRSRRLPSRTQRADRKRQIRSAREALRGPFRSPEPRCVGLDDRPRTTLVAAGGEKERTSSKESWVAPSAVTVSRNSTSVRAVCCNASRWGPSPTTMRVLRSISTHATGLPTSIFRRQPPRVQKLSDTPSPWLRPAEVRLHDHAFGRQAGLDVLVSDEAAHQGGTVRRRRSSPWIGGSWPNRIHPRPIEFFDH